MQDFDQIASIIRGIQIIAEAVKDERADEKTVQELQMSVQELNSFLYHAPKLKFQKDHDLKKKEEYGEYVEEVETLILLWKQTIQRRRGKMTDVEFWDTYEYFKYVNGNVIYQTVVNHFRKLPEGIRIEYLSLPHRYTFLQNRIDITSEDFSLIAQHVEMMVNEVENYKWLYERLADDRSKAVLNGIIRYWFQFDLNRLHGLCETIFPDYYDLDILECGKDDVMVDLGAYTGDSVLNYIHTYGLYKKIYAYEITPSVYELLVRNLSNYQNVLMRKKGVGSKAGTMYVNDGDHKAGNKLLREGEFEVEVVTLDEDIKEPVSVIKMDIEGAEKEAVLGASSHIKRDKPKMLVSSYHLPEDIFEIPKLIDEIRDDYRFYMRFNGRGCLWPCDYVLFAV